MQNGRVIAGVTLFPQLKCLLQYPHDELQDVADKVMSWIVVLLRDRGMNYIVGKDWRDLFDVVIVQADKPGFFNDRRK